MCEATLDGGVASTYAFTPQEVLNQTLGDWSGSYPGGPYASEFDIDVTVSELLEPGYGEGVQYFQPRVMGSGYEITPSDKESCVAMGVPASVRVGTSLATSDLDREFRSIHVKGDMRLPWQVAGFEDSTPRGIPLVAAEIDSGGQEIEYTILFAADGSLWVDVHPDYVLETDFRLSGWRQPDDLF